MAKKDPAPDTNVPGMSFAILSAPGTFHTPHWDPNGMSTALNIADGFKVFLVGVPTESTMHALVPAPTSTSLWPLMEQDHLLKTIVVLGKNDTMYVFFFVI